MENPDDSTRHLPIFEHIPAVRKALEEKGRAVVAAAPGAGKTTGIPLALLDEPFLKDKKILMLEPRRLATRMAAARMAELLGEPLGKTVGYQIRNERVAGPGCRIMVMTEGILTRKIQNDPELDGVGLVIFDEFHERNIQTDLGLALCLDIAGSLRPDLKILVMSATVDTDSVAGLLGQAPVICSEGVCYPVETIYRKWKAPERSSAVNVKDCAAQVVKALEHHDGDILVFLPGAGEIRALNDLLSGMVNGAFVRVHPLYGNLDKKEQDAAVRPSETGFRKVVLATSIAETSLTIEGVTVVIDSGFMRVPRYYSGSSMGRLETWPVSRASADQRRGRAGRLAPGVCYRMWAEEDNALHPEFNTPEILQADLTGLVLELALWGVREPDTLSWLDSPPYGPYVQAQDHLKKIGAVDGGGRITAHGKSLSALGLHPRWGHMLVSAKKMGMGSLACHLASLIGERDFILSSDRERPSDVRLRLAVLRGAKNGEITGDEETRGLAVNRGTVTQVLRNAEKLERDLGITPSTIEPENAGRLLAWAYPERIAMAVKGAHGVFKMASGSAVYVSESDPLSLESMIICVDLDGRRTRAKVFLAAPYSMELIEDDFSHAITRSQVLEWDSGSRSVLSVIRQSYENLVLRSEISDHADPQAVRVLMMDRIRKEGLDVLPWTPSLLDLRARALFVRHASASEDFPDLGEQALESSLERWLEPFLDGVRSFNQLKKIDLTSAVMNLLSWDARKKLDELAPTHLTVPSGSRIPLDYRVVDNKLHTSPVLNVRLQEMFGCLETPRVAGGRVPVTVQLLSPAGRVMQVTKDLASFWKNTYEQVKKDLKGRYPKHYWPDDPYSATATSRTKKHMDKKP